MPNIILSTAWKMDFANGDLNANLVHHQQHNNNNLNLHQDDMPDLRTNSLNNILKNNIISSGGSHSPGLMMPDINNNSSNDLNLNEDPMGHTGCNGNVSVNEMNNASKERHPLNLIWLQVMALICNCDNNITRQLLRLPEGARRVASV